MFERFQRSLRLIRTSTRVLNADGELLFLPILSGIVSAIVGGLLFWQAFGLGVFEQVKDGGSAAGLYAWLFVFYVIEYFIVYFFNTALVGAAVARLNGENPTVGSALRLAASRAGHILGYAIIAATVGMILRIIADRAGFVGKLIAGGAGLAWSIATFLVVPILAVEGIGPLAAIEKSATLLKKTWGENLIGNAGMSIVFAAIGTVLILIIYGGGMLLYTNGAEHAALLLATVVALLFVALIVFAAALAGVYQAAVYYYAVNGEPPEGYEKELLTDAFSKKG
jgi:hypothetical protein